MLSHQAWISVGFDCNILQSDIHLRGTQSMSSLSGTVDLRVRNKAEEIYATIGGEVPTLFNTKKWKGKIMGLVYERRGFQDPFAEIRGCPCRR